MDDFAVLTIVFCTAPVAAIFIAYFFLIKYRQKRYREIAAQLNARYIKQGRFEPGKIIGEKDGRQFFIKPYTVRQGRSVSYYTLVSTTNDAVIRPVIINPRFFLSKRPSLNFKYIYGFDPDKKKSIFDQLFNWSSEETVLDYKIPFDPKDQDRFKEVFSSMPSNFYYELKSLNTLYIYAGESSVDHNLPGIVTDMRKLNTIFYINNCIAEKIKMLH